MTAITRNPRDNQTKGYFVSDWYGVRVAWQGTDDLEPRMLMPWEFIRADDRKGTVDFLNGVVTDGKPEVNKQSGEVKIHVAKSSQHCKCRNLMMDVEWWVLGNSASEKVYWYDHPLFLPYTPRQKQKAVNDIIKWRADRLIKAGIVGERVDSFDTRTDVELGVIRKALLS